MYKDKFKGIKDLNIRPETIKFLEENIGRTFLNINHSKILFDLLPGLFVLMEVKTKIDKWDLIKLKSFHTAKGNYNKMKKQPSDWKKNNCKLSK